MIALALVLAMFFVLVVGITGTILGIDTIVWVVRRARWIEFRPSWLCVKCGYDLRGLDGRKCPECGTKSQDCRARPDEPGPAAARSVWRERGTAGSVLAVHAALLFLVYVGVRAVVGSAWGAAELTGLWFGLATVCSLIPLLISRRNFTRGEILWLAGSAFVAGVIGALAMWGVVGVAEDPLSGALVFVVGAAVVPASAGIGARVGRDIVEQFRAVREEQRR